MVNIPETLLKPYRTSRELRALAYPGSITIEEKGPRNGYVRVHIPRDQIPQLIAFLQAMEADNG